MTTPLYEPPYWIRHPLPSDPQLLVKAEQEAFNEGRDWWERPVSVKRYTVPRQNTLQQEFDKPTKEGVFERMKGHYQSGRNRS